MNRCLKTVVLFRTFLNQWERLHSNRTISAGKSSSPPPPAYSLYRCPYVNMVRNFYFGRHFLWEPIRIQPFIENYRTQGVYTDKCKVDATHLL